MSHRRKNHMTGQAPSEVLDGNRPAYFLPVRFRKWRAVGTSQNQPSMKAKRRGLSLGAAYRIAQSERNKKADNISRTTKGNTRPTKDGRPEPSTGYTSPEKDDLDESDLDFDIRARALLNKFTSHAGNPRNPLQNGPELKASQTTSLNPLKRKADSLSTNAPRDGPPERAPPGGSRLYPVENTKTKVDKAQQKPKSSAKDKLLGVRLLAKKPVVLDRQKPAKKESLHWPKIDLQPVKKQFASESSVRPQLTVWDSRRKLISEEIKAMKSVDQPVYDTGSAISQASKSNGSLPPKDSPLKIPDKKVTSDPPLEVFTLPSVKEPVRDRVACRTLDDLPKNKSALCVLRVPKQSLAQIATASQAARSDRPSKPFRDNFSATANDRVETLRSPLLRLTLVESSDRPSTPPLPESKGVDSIQGRISDTDPKIPVKPGLSNENMFTRPEEDNTRNLNSPRQISQLFKQNAHYSSKCLLGNNTSCRRGTSAQPTTQHKLPTSSNTKNLSPLLPKCSSKQHPPKFDTLSCAISRGTLRWKGLSHLKPEDSNTKPTMPPKPKRSEPMARRSTRNKAPISNYYATPAGFHSRATDDYRTEDESIPISDSTPEPTSPANKVAPIIKNSPRVIYQSKYLHVTQEPLNTETPFSIAHNLPYIDHQRRSNLRKFKAGEVIHVDLGLNEIKAIYAFLGGDASDFLNSDAPIQSLISRVAVRYRRQGGDLTTLARQIHYLHLLNCQLQRQEQSIDTFLFGIKGCTGNMDFDCEKLKTISQCLKEIFQVHDDFHGEAIHVLWNILDSLKDDWISKLAVKCQQAGQLQLRDRVSIRRFFKDAISETLNVSPCLLRVVSGTSNCHLSHDANASVSTSTLLRARELGYPRHRNRIGIDRCLNEKQAWGHWKSWTGASGDILTLAWSPDGTCFAAGAAAHTDPHSMQYNRNNNLLLGDLTVNQLKELPDHRINRPIEESGPNAQGTYIMVDPNLYMTVTALHWTSSDKLYSASFDSTVKVWDVSSQSGARCTKTLQHPGRVQQMAVSHFNEQLLAIGSNGPSFQIWNIGEPDSRPSALLSEPGKYSKMTPSSLQWGKTPRADRLLVGGLSEDADHGTSKYGYLALWRLSETAVYPEHLTPNSQNIFDIVWHPTLDIFATGCSTPFNSRSYGLGKDVRSLIRIYDPLHNKCNVQAYECPALDINQVTFCPADDNYVTASCTDGITYVWDHRNPNRILHRLKHGEPINDLEPDSTREESDVGVRCALWGRGFDFYTGSSDGVVKKWDIRLASENVLQDNVASFGLELMSASMSPDFTNMVLGDDAGGIHVISTAPWGHEDDKFDTFDLKRAPEPSTEKIPQTPQTPQIPQTLGTPGFIKSPGHPERRDAEKPAQARSHKKRKRELSGTRRIRYGRPQQANPTFKIDPNNLIDLTLSSDSENDALATLAPFDDADGELQLEEDYWFPMPGRDGNFR